MIKNTSEQTIQKALSARKSPEKKDVKRKKQQRTLYQFPNASYARNVPQSKTDWKSSPCRCNPLMTFVESAYSHHSFPRQNITKTPSQ